MPFIQHEASSHSSRKKRTVPLLSLSMDGNALSDAFQTMYGTIKDNLQKRAEFSGEESDDDSLLGSDIDDQKLASILDDVEETLCELFYNR